MRLAILFDSPVVVRPTVPVSAIPDSSKRKHPHWGDRQLLTPHILHDILEPDRPDDALAYLELAVYKNLTALRLNFTGVTGTGLKQLAAIKNLATLDLSGTEVSETGLKELAALRSLTTLHLIDATVGQH